MLICLCCLQLLSGTMAEVRGYQRDYMAPKGKNICYLTFYSKILLTSDLAEKHYKDNEGLAQGLKSRNKFGGPCDWSAMCEVET